MQLEGGAEPGTSLRPAWKQLYTSYTVQLYSPALLRLYTIFTQAWHRLGTFDFRMFFIGHVPIFMFLRQPFSSVTTHLPQIHANFTPGVRERDDNFAPALYLLQPSLAPLHEL